MFKLLAARAVVRPLEIELIAQVVIETLESTTSIDATSAADKCSRSYLHGYLMGALDATLKRRQIPPKERDRVTDAARARIFSLRRELDMKDAIAADDSDFAAGQSSGRLAVRCFLDPERPCSP